MRPKVLQIAYCCSPFHGSEEGLGWNVARETARHCDTWVLTEEKKFGPSIRRYLDEQGPVPGLHFEFLPERIWAAGMWKARLGYLSYKWWHQRALKSARRLHEKHRFDLVHQVNIIGFREPGYLHQLGVPFVWGPVGGGQNYPYQFLSEASWGGRLMETARTLLNTCQSTVCRRPRAAASVANCTIAANRENQSLLHRLGAQDPRVISEVSTTPKANVAAAPRSTDGVLRILWSGLHTTRKALSLLLKALAKSTNKSIELTVLGAGSETTRWKKLAKQLGVSNQIRWLGWLPHDQAVSHFQSADLFAFTSLRDTTGTVLVESLSFGTPVLCLDHQGASEVITQDCGVKIPVVSPTQVVDDLASAIAGLASNRAELTRLGEGALRRSQEYTAAKLGERIWREYQAVWAACGGPSLEPTSPVQ